MAKQGEHGEEIIFYYLSIEETTGVKSSIFFYLGIVLCNEQNDARTLSFFLIGALIFCNTLAARRSNTIHVLAS